MNTYSYLKANVSDVHRSWIETLREINTVSGDGRAICIEHLRDLYLRAQALKDTDQLDAQLSGAIQHILQRPLSEHLLAIKRSTSKNIL